MKNTERKISALWLLFSGLAVMTALIVVGIGYFVLTRDYRRFEVEANRLRADYTRSQEQLIKNEVDKVVDFIQYNCSKTEERLKASIKERTYEALAIATNLYDRLHGREGGEAIRTIIVDALRPIRFNGGRGYFFATGLDGVEMLFADHPELEGKSLLDMQDSRGSYVIREMIELVSHRGEGFYRYVWTKPNVQGRDFPKIAYIKYFAPLNCFIGTGEYLDDMEQDVQREVLERIQRIRFGQDGYIFVVAYDGTTLMNGLQPEFIGKSILNMTDPYGVRVFEEERRAADKPEGDYIYYHWQKPSTKQISPKISFVKGFPQWEWLIGAGVYNDEIESTIAIQEAEVKRKMLEGAFGFAVLLFGILLGSLILCYFLSRYFKRQLDIFLSFFHNMETGGRAIATEQLFLREFEELGKSANKMLTMRQHAEAELRENEAKYRALIETTDTGFVIIDQEGRVFDANQEYVRLTGHRHLNEILGRSIIEWTADSQKEKNALAVRKCFEEGYARNLEFDYVDSQGKVAPIEINATLVERRGTPQILTLCRDITERKQAEEASRTHIHFLESLDLIDQAIKQETDVEKMLWNVMKEVFEIFVCDRAWLFYPCDPDAPSFRVPVEINRSEYPGARALNLEVPLVPDMAKDLRDALASEDPLPYTLGTEKPVNTLTAQQFAVQAQMFTAIYPKIGKPWVFGMHQCSYPRIWSPQEQKLFKEIGRRIAEGLSSVLFLREVKDNEERFRATFEQAAVGMAHVAPDGRLLRVNQKLCDIVGYSRDELLQKTLQDITQPDDLDADQEYVRQVLTGVISTFSMEKRYLRKDGSVVWINLTVSIVRHPSGDPEYFISVIEDITERKQAEEDRRTLQERLYRAEKMEALGTLGGGVAHDLNNVLGIVVGYSELLLDHLDESSSARSKAKEILKAGQRAAAIVQDLLTLARRGVPSREVLNLNSILLECQHSPEFAKELSYHPNIEIKTDLEPDLLNVSGSSIHLGKSFMNLVSNAAEAMPNGGTLTVKTANCYLDKPISGYDEVREGDYVVLSISDTGEGIRSSDLKRIFEPFFTRKAMGRSGTGLGLAVVWGTVKDHLGYVNAESKEGKGTTFTLYFPVTREELSSDEVAVSAAVYMGNGESILVVDDVKEQRDLATLMLTKLNYQVTSVSSGEEAVQYVQEHRVALVILDMIMDPGMDGLDTYRKILEVHPHQKAILVSGFSETERVSKAQALGAGAYVKKPYVLEKLGLAVRKEIDRLQ